MCEFSIFDKEDVHILWDIPRVISRDMHLIKYARFFGALYQCGYIMNSMWMDVIYLSAFFNAASLSFWVVILLLLWYQLSTTEWFWYKSGQKLFFS